MVGPCGHLVNVHVADGSAFGASDREELAVFAFVGAAVGGTGGDGDAGAAVGAGGVFVGHEQLFLFQFPNHLALISPHMADFHHDHS